MVSSAFALFQGTAPPVIQVATPVPVPAPVPVVVPQPKPVVVQPPVSTPRPDIPKVNNHIEDNVRRSRSRNALTPSDQLSDTEVLEKKSWKKEYKKKFHCRLCFSSYSNKKYLKVHSTKHKALKAKHRNVFKKYCLVQLSKIDGIPNFTGSDKRVVYNNKKIIESRYTDHYIMYLNGDELDNRNSYPKIDSRCNSSDSSNFDLSIARKRAKRRRISSSTSNETVVIGNKNNGEIKIQPGISIDDSDDEAIAAGKNKEMLLERIAKETSKDGTIGKIITICCMKYEKSQSDFNVSDNVGMQIKRKILSLGRKIINSKNFNSNVLLKFLQYKNLDIAWVSRSVMHSNTTESNFVKIQTRKKNDSDKDKIETNWVDHSPSKDDLQFSYEQCCIGCDTSYAAVCVTPVLESISNEQPNEQPNEINVTDMSDSAVLCSMLTNDTKKLLNANPVANPKQLPKKCATTIEKVSPKISSAPEPEICMPIITSTTSLAEIEKPVPDGPRIKVKPVSELMSKESLDLLLEPRVTTRVNVSQSQPVTENQSQAVSNIYIIPGNVMSMSNNMPMITVATMSPFTNTIVSATGSVTEAPKNTADYVILDTVELPNTRTYSPFNYFKKILQMHNIILLDPDAVLSSEFHCVIRFKVCYNQESKTQPLTLSLSLYCRQNVFCLKIKGPTQGDIDMSKITANWQWEILKIYKGEVVKKIIETATKLGQETLEYTSSFLCLLKSINKVPESYFL